VILRTDSKTNQTIKQSINQSIEKSCIAPPTNSGRRRLTNKNNKKLRVKKHN